MASAATWHERVGQWRASGLKATEFAETRGWSVHQLWNWAAKFRKEDPGEAVGPDPTKGRSTAPAASATKTDGVRLARVLRVPTLDSGVQSSPLSVEFSEVRIVVPDGFDRSTFAMVLDTIERQKARPGGR